LRGCGTEQGRRTSTHTSLCCKNRGIVAACTGVMFVNPKESTTCNVIGDSAGSTEPNASAMAKKKGWVEAAL
jgi:hypothetical protein